MKIRYRAHAVQRMFERGISARAVRDTLTLGQEIASYQQDYPYPSRLLLGWQEGRPLHVVAAYNAEDEEHIVITVYEPDAALWDTTFRRRKE